MEREATAGEDRLSLSSYRSWQLHLDSISVERTFPAVVAHIYTCSAAIVGKVTLGLESVILFTQPHCPTHWVTKSGQRAVTQFTLSQSLPPLAYPVEHATVVVCNRGCHANSIVTSLSRSSCYCCSDAVTSNCMQCVVASSWAPVYWPCDELCDQLHVALAQQPVLYPFYLLEQVFLHAPDRRQECVTWRCGNNMVVFGSRRQGWKSKGPRRLQLGSDSGTAVDQATNIEGSRPSTMGKSWMEPNPITPTLVLGYISGRERPVVMSNLDLDGKLPLLVKLWPTNSTQSMRKVRLQR